MADGLFPGLEPHHVALSVRDLDDALTFWKDIFGFELDFQTEILPIKARLAFIKRGALRLELFEVEGSAPPPDDRLRPNTDLKTQGTKHLCFSVNEPQGALEILFDRGVEIVGVMRDPKSGMHSEEDPRVSPGDGRLPALAFFFLDPSGCLVEILRRSDFNQ